MRGTECARKNTRKGQGARLLWARVSKLGQHSHVNQQEWIQFDQHTRHSTSSSNVARCVGHWLAVCSCAAAAGERNVCYNNDSG